MIIREALVLGQKKLNASGIESSNLDVSLLLAHVLNIEQTKLIAIYTDFLSEEKLTLFHKLLERRIEGECIAYILGKKEFWGIEFIVNSAVLVPRPDTEILVEEVLKLLAADNKNQEAENNIRVLDLCTGSGAIAIALKSSMPALTIWATDICEKALEVAKKNAEKLLAPNTIQFFQGNLYEALPASNSRQFDIITSNPPYILSGKLKSLPPEVQKEPRLALDGGIDGLDIIRKIIEDAPDYLKPGGKLFLEADPDQMNTISLLLEKNGYSSIKKYKDLSGLERVICGH